MHRGGPGGPIRSGILIVNKTAYKADALLLLAAFIWGTVFAALSGWAILDEFLNQRELVGCAFMLAGMLVAQLFPRSKKVLL